MARIRTVKPEFYTHEELSALPAETHLLAGALINYADDDGYFNANPVLLKAGTTPLRNDQTRIEEQIAQLKLCGFIEVRASGLKCLGWIVNFLTHQRVSNPTPSKLKAKFAELPSGYGITTEQLPKTSVENPEALRPEGKGKEQGTGKGKEQSAQQARGEFSLPGWVDRKALDRFTAMRKKNRKPVTDDALPLLVMKLDALRRAGNDPTAVLDQSTMNSWQGLFEVKGDGKHASREAIVGLNSEPQSAEEIEADRAWFEAKGKARL